jgi:hypothetical protein
VEARSADEAAKLAFLREVGLADVVHVRVSLLDHVVATRDLLARWGAPPALRDAALFHAVYGTEEIDPRLDRPPVPASERERVRGIIGAEAERLVWLFRSLDRKRFVRWAADGAEGEPPQRRGGRLGPLPPEEVSAVANLVVANAMEQIDRRRRSHRRRARKLYCLRAHLLPGAREALRYERRWLRVLRSRMGWTVRPNPRLSRGPGSGGSGAADPRCSARTPGP